MLKLKLLLRLAYFCSASTSLLVVTAVVGFVLRWAGVTVLPWLSSNAGHLLFAAACAGAGCYLAMLKARNLALDLSDAQAKARADEAAAALPSQD